MSNEPDDIEYIRLYNRHGLTPAVAHYIHYRRWLITGHEAPLHIIGCTNNGRCWHFRARGTGWQLWRAWPELTGHTINSKPIDNEALMAEGTGTNPHDEPACINLADTLMRYLTDPIYPLAHENPASRPTPWTPNAWHYDA